MPHYRTYGGRVYAEGRDADGWLTLTPAAPSDRVTAAWRKHARSDVDERRAITRHVHLRRMRGTERQDFVRLMLDRIADTQLRTIHVRERGVVTDEVHLWVDGYRPSSEGRGE